MMKSARRLCFLGAILFACLPALTPSAGNARQIGTKTPPLAADHATLRQLPPIAQKQIGEAVREALDRGELPGAVVAILSRDEVLLQKAYGCRSKQPASCPMTTDTIFDLASLTKPIATATSIFILIEQGKLQLADRVALHWPEFGKNGKEKITVAQLLLHTGGLMADNPPADYQTTRAKALEKICGLAPVAEPGTKFIYSDVGYIVLGELVEKLSGMPLDEFAAKHIFGPLGMVDTCFRPTRNSELLSRIAPTEIYERHYLVGQVHDPRARALGGVAGHAGLFSTADDLARFTRMLLHAGELDGRRILRAESVKTMTAPRSVPGGLRSYGWDVDTSYSRNRGETYPRGKSFGHTGFTGTSIWIDPGSNSGVIFLSNRLHPDGKGNVTRLRGQVATIAASAILPSHSGSTTVTGIDILVREQFKRLQGRHIGLVTNHSGSDSASRTTIDLLHQAKGVTLVALFSPEHGIRGTADERLSDSKDRKTGLSIYSLYGPRKKPTAETLRGVDTLVYDIQDAGCRFYTYITTLGYVLEAAAQHKLKVVVLDRPNPIGGLAVDGPVLDPGGESFIAYHRLPVRHGLTVGELARLFNAERKIGADLEVVPMEGWHRGMLLDQTGLAWINPSPNLRSLTETLLYPGIGLLETTNVSVGRGTDRPFEWIGAPWLDGRRLAKALRQENIPGVRFIPLALTPNYSTHRGKACEGVQIMVDDWHVFEPIRTGLAVACVLRRLYPKEWDIDSFNKLLGHQTTWKAVKDGARWRELPNGWSSELKKFGEVRDRYLIYRD